MAFEGLGQLGLGDLGFGESCVLGLQWGLGEGLAGPVASALDVQYVCASSLDEGLERATSMSMRFMMQVPCMHSVCKRVSICASLLQAREGNPPLPLPSAKRERKGERERESSLHTSRGRHWARAEGETSLPLTLPKEREIERAALKPEP